MDPDNLTPFIDLKDENKSDAVVTGDIFKVQHSDSESGLEFAISESELEEERNSTSEDDIEDGKSVHIIFVRNENESAHSSPEKLSTMNGSVETFSEGTSVTIHPPLSEGENSDVPCRIVTCPNEDSGSESEVMNYVSDRNTDEEVEEDFDTSTDMIFQVDQESPLPNTPRKRKKKKVCKVCGTLVERKDLLSHIREHRLRKSKFAQNKLPDTTEKPLEPSRKPLSPTEKVSLLSNSVRAVSNIEGDKNFPQSCVNNSASDRPFKCNVCSETFRTQSGLTIHFKSHSGECSNSCPVS